MSKRYISHIRTPDSRSLITTLPTVDAANKVGPSIGLNNLSKGYTHYGASKVTYENKFSNEKLKNVLGLTPISLEDTVKEILLDLKNRGWL